jgi:hypothetical protein
MVHVVFSVLLFFVVMAVTAMLFGGWVIVSIARLIGRLFSGPQDPPMRIGSGPVCPNEQCRTANPPGANYCRRCGRNLSGEARSFRRTGMIA